MRENGPDHELAEKLIDLRDYLEVARESCGMKTLRMSEFQPWVQKNRHWYVENSEWFDIFRLCGAYLKPHKVKGKIVKSWFFPSLGRVTIEAVREQRELENRHATLES